MTPDDPRVRYDDETLDSAIKAARAAFDVACSNEGRVLDDPTGAVDRPWHAAISAAALLVRAQTLRDAADELERPGIARLVEAWPTVFEGDEVFAEQVVRVLFGLLRERAVSE